VQVTELSASEQLPVKFLEQIMQLLKEAGLVESQRGKFGGYRLARPAGGILIGQVVRLIDGPLAPIGCVSQSAYEKCSCPDETHCGLRMLMLDVRNAIANIVDRYSLADVVEVTLRKMRRDGVPLPFTQPLRAVQQAHERRKHPRAASSGRLQPVEGLINNLLGDYAI
jgi:Rrf2 family protein